jgi:hypothetical protein
MIVITQTATVNRFTRPRAHLAAFQRVQPPYAVTEPTVSVSIEAGLVRIMAELLNGSDPIAF